MNVMHHKWRRSEASDVLARRCRTPGYPASRSSALCPSPRDWAVGAKSYEVEGYRSGLANRGTAAKPRNSFLLFDSHSN